MPYTIMLDSGHGGRDPGAVYNGRQEKDDALRLALAIGEIYKIAALMSYTPAPKMSMNPPSKSHGSQHGGCRFLLSIHRNSYPYRQYRLRSGISDLR